MIYEKRIEYTGVPKIMSSEAINKPVINEKPVIIDNIAPVIIEAPVNKEYNVFFSILVKDIKNMLTIFKPFNLIEGLKLYFKNNEIFISCVDPAHVCMLTEKIPVRSTLEYKVILNDLNEIALSVDLERFLNMFKGSNKNDILTFKYSSVNEKIVNISIGSFNHTLNLLDNSNIPDAPKIPVLNLPSSFEIDIKTFNTFLNQANSISDHMQIKTTSNDLTLFANNPDSDNNINLVLTRDQLIMLNSNSTHKSLFAIDYMINIFKGLKPLFQNIIVNLGDNHPLKITGSGISEIMVLLAPRIEES